MVTVYRVRILGRISSAYIGRSMPHANWIRREGPRIIRYYLKMNLDELRKELLDDGEANGIATVAACGQLQSTAFIFDISQTVRMMKPGGCLG